MTWIKIEDTLPDNPKMINAGPDAGWLYVCGLCYSSRMLTDGMIPKAMVPRLTDIKKPLGAASELVSAGLWIDSGDHYMIHDYLEHQRSRDQIENERKKSRERQNKHRARSRRDTPVSNAGDDAVSHSHVTQPETESETEKETPSPAERDDQFEAFWEAYPKRNGKRIGKAKTLAVWKRLSKVQKAKAFAAAKHYASAVDQGLTIARDPQRFLNDQDIIEEYLTPAARAASNGSAQPAPMPQLCRHHVPARDCLRCRQEREDGSDVTIPREEVTQ